MKIIKSTLRVVSLLFVCYAIYLMCFNVTFNAMVEIWIAFYFYYVASKIKTESIIGKCLGDIDQEILQLYDEDSAKIETELLDCVRNIIAEADCKYGNKLDN